MKDTDKCTCGDQRSDHRYHKGIYRGCSKCLCTSFLLDTPRKWQPADMDRES